MITLSTMFDSMSSSSCTFVGFKFSGGSAISMDETGCKRWLSFLPRCHRMACIPRGQLHMLSKLPAHLIPDLSDPYQGLIKPPKAARGHVTAWLAKCKVLLNLAHRSSTT